METVLLVIHLLIAVALIAVVLLQRSEGGALGIGGGGGGGSLFSSRGVGNALTRTTAILAAAFFVTSIGLTLLATHRGGSGSILDNVPTTQGQAPSQTGSGDSQGGNVLPQLPSAPQQPKVPDSP